MEWYLKAADANQADACYNLALLAFEVQHASSIPHCLFLRVDWLQMFPVALLCAMQKPMVSCVCVRERERERVKGSVPCRKGGDGMSRLAAQGWGKRFC